MHHLLAQEMSLPEILCVYGKQFKQIKRRFSDEHNDRCAMGLILSYYGMVILIHQSRGTIIKLNDSGKTFDEIADYLDSSNSR